MNRFFNRKKIKSGYENKNRVFTIWNKPPEEDKYAYWKLAAWIAAAILLLIVGSCIVSNGQTVTYKKTTYSDILYSSAIGVGDSMEYLKCDIVQPNNDKLHPLCVWIHGGGGGEGDKSGGMHPIADPLVTKLGVTNVYPNYRLADLSQFKGDSIKCTLLMHEEMYRTLSDAYACVRFMLLHNNTYHIDPNQVYICGVSWGCVAAELAVHWQPSEYADCDTMKWRNTSNGNATFTIAGAIGLSGACFTVNDVDKTDKPLIICYGLKDNTLKCNGGSNHKCPYIGDCQVKTLSMDLGNPIYMLAFPNAMHCLKSTDPISTALNLSKAKSYFLSTLKTLIH